MSLISVVLPVYNEEELIESSYNRLIQALAPLEMQGDAFELVFVDDGCHDKSFPILKEIAKTDTRVKLVSFARNYGHQTAITAGMKYAQGDAVVTIDADMQDPPELINDMVAKWREGYDVVYGVHKKRAGETFFKKITAHVFYRMLASLTSIKIPTDSGDFRLFSRQVCDDMNALPEHNRYIRGLMVWIGYKHTPLKFDRDERKAGETKYTLKKMLKLASDGVLGFSYSPITAIWKLGFLFILLAIFSAISVPILLCGKIAIIIASIILFLIVLVFLFKLMGSGGFIKLISSIFTTAILLLISWGSLGIFNYNHILFAILAPMLFLTGIILIATGIIGEYITRMMDEVRGRPLYTVKETVNIEK